MSAPSATVTTPLRVLIVTPAFPPGMHVGGGVAVTYKVLSDKLARLGGGVSCKVLSTWNGALDYMHLVLDPEFRFIHPSGRNLAILRAAIANCDALVFPDTEIFFWLGLEAARQGVPAIWVLHTNFMRMAEHRMAALEHAFFDAVVGGMMRRLSRIVTRVYTTSRDYLLFLHQNGLRVDGYIDQGFKTDIFREPDDPKAVLALKQQLTGEAVPSKPIMLFAGRFSNEKRIHLVIKAKPANFVLVLIGDGYLRDQLLELHDPSKGIIVISHMLPQDELRRYYKAANMVVSASDFETYGMTIHEALLCGTPVVVQDAKGFKMQVKHGVNGFLIDYVDTPAATAALQLALTHHFDVKPLPDPHCMDFVQVCVDTARIKLEKPGFWLRLWYSLLQTMFIVALRITTIFYHLKPPTNFSHLPTAPPSAKPKLRE